MWSGVRTVNSRNTLTSNGAADLAPPRSNTGTVPDHAILGSLVGFSHSVVQLVDFIIAPFLCYRRKAKREGVCHMCIIKGRDVKNTTNKLTFRFAFTLDASDSMAGTDQSAAQIRPFPLVIHGIEVAILYTTI